MVTVELQSVNLSWLHFELHMESHFWLQLVLCGLRMWFYMLEVIEQSHYSCSCLILRKHSD